MAAILGAFVQYILSFIFCAAVAGLGIFCGIKLHDKDKKSAQ
ncbi:MAG: vanadium nitrogenase [Eubacteriales bacterium]|nr:vanadium nitrogenase [Eubacteriales bacterium]